MEKAERHRALLELVGAERIGTQAELRAALSARYRIACDQGTISRDIKELGLVRLSDASGTYYGRTTAALPGSNEAFLLSRLARGAQAAGNLVVVHTDAANAHPVAEALDRLGFPEVVGTVAGDNTVLVVAKTAAKARRVVERIAQIAGLNSQVNRRRIRSGAEGKRKR
ncbi:MAG: arginine repressor [Chloracidobacterium sp. CP2_5A]|nr:MAG: arginine repressor [Chloracidobacterium sp. CP2_5A]